VTIDFGSAKVVDVFPKQVSDLFAGTQLVFLGRYKNSSDTALILEGWRSGAKVGTAQDLSYPSKNSSNAFIKQLWATRKVGYLLDEIRLNGENNELVQEVTRLGKEFGIVTPYTSYLVTEQMATGNNLRGTGADSTTMSDLDRVGSLGGAKAGPPQPTSIAQGRMNKRKEYKRYMRSQSSFDAEEGESAVAVGKAISGMKDSNRVVDQSGYTRHAGEKTFVWQNGYYVDTSHKQSNKVLKIQYGSDAYFRLLELYPKAKTLLALGENVIFSLKSGTSVIIDNNGAKTVSDNKIKSFLP